jgi:NAD(P)-dependent dehydrogenase (short-subunit alcohol dehydrogenase family)
MTMGALDGKVALVTGASRGIGRGIAERLARDGALVAVNFAGHAEAAGATVAAIEAGGGAAFAVQAEIGTPEATAALFTALDAEVERRTGEARLDILVNNAGVAVFGTFRETSLDDFDRLFRVNVRGTFLVTQAALPRLRDGGKIVNISSNATRLALGEIAVYTVSKAAVDMLTRILARELGPRRITVNSVAPGWVATDGNASVRQDPAATREIEGMTALGRFGQPADVAEVVHFLVTPPGAWVTGQSVEASGGYRL